jgi:hypothetical protein
MRHGARRRSEEIMRHRLYYLLPDVTSARRAMDEMLLNRIEARHVRFLANCNLPDDLPEAGFLFKTDIIRGAEAGMMIGALLGILLGAVVIFYFDTDAHAAVMTAATLCGLLFGGWASSLAAAAVPNTRLKHFFNEVECGKVLMIVDVPARRVSHIEQVMAERHPEVNFRGEEPNIPAFP